ncbi:hypothetical protein ACIF8T_21850 [Streptomyces sp. NPDC085946]|uniref:hypothetical protein n=1 Tax=Streptomyces sp. NPDC085946 TaxID=3365744 RepID=UPI0037D2D347
MAAKETHTTARPVRIPKEDWDDFGALVGDRERSRLIREFIAWYLRRPKATLPKRPDPASLETELETPAAPRKRKIKIVRTKPTESDD